MLVDIKNSKKASPDAFFSQNSSKHYFQGIGNAICPFIPIHSIACNQVQASETHKMSTRFHANMGGCSHSSLCAVSEMPSKMAKLTRVLAGLPAN